MTDHAKFRTRLVLHVPFGGPIYIIMPNCAQIGQLVVKIWSFFDSSRWTLYCLCHLEGYLYVTIPNFALIVRQTVVEIWPFSEKKFKILNAHTLHKGPTFVAEWGCRCISASPGLQDAHLEIPGKLIEPTFSPSTYIALTPHTPIKSPPPWAGTLDHFKRSQRQGPE